MRTIEVKQLKYDLTPVAGLALVGDHLKTLAPVLRALDKSLPVRAGVANSDIVRSYLGLLVQGKSDFDAIENHRGEAFCKQALGIGAYGWCLELSLRPGVQHSAKHTEEDLRRVIPLAQRLSAAGPKAPLLARLDSGFDSAALMACLESMNRPGQAPVDWLIKWNPRSTDRVEMAAGLDARSSEHGQPQWRHPRVGKRVALWASAWRCGSRRCRSPALNVRCGGCCAWWSAPSAPQAST